MINGAVSYWWVSLGGPPPRRPPLPGPLEADVAIVGGGYTGLWTAWYLKRADPGLRVVVLEREFCGFGASGRNGGWLSGLLAGSRERWAAELGREKVIAVQRAMFATVEEVVRWCTPSSPPHRGPTTTRRAGSPSRCASRASTRSTGSTARRTCARSTPGRPSRLGALASRIAGR